MANNLTYFILITASLIMLMFVIDQSMSNVSNELGLTSATDIFTYEGSNIEKYDSTGNFTLDQDVSKLLPSGEGSLSVDENTGNIFTDTFQVIKNWLLETTGFNLILDLVNALPNLLKLIFAGKYSVFAFGIGYFWNLAFIVSVVFWIKGGGS